MKYHVEKSIDIEASADKVKPFIENFEKWPSWSPWNIVEPACKMNAEGIPGQAGHKQSWEGEIIGSGTNTLESVDENGYHYDLRFLTPRKDKAKTSLLLKEEGGMTTVTWTLDSDVPFFAFFMVDIIKNWIGMDYDRGLRMLKEVVEKGEVKATTTNEGTVEQEGFSYIGIKRTLPVADMPSVMKTDFEKLYKDVVVEKRRGAKHWICVYPMFSFRKMMATYIVAVSDEDLKGIDLGAGYVKGEIKSGKALEIKHKGAYDFLGNAWSMGMMYMRAKKIRGGGFPYEEYWNNPNEVSAEELETSIYFPLK